MAPSWTKEPRRLEEPEEPRKLEELEERHTMEEMEEPVRWENGQLIVRIRSIRQSTSQTHV